MIRKYPEYSKTKALKAKRDEKFALKHKGQKTAGESPASITERASETVSGGWVCRTLTARLLLPSLLGLLCVPRDIQC